MGVQRSVHKFKGMFGNAIDKDIEAIACTKLVTHANFNLGNCKQVTHLFDKNLPNIVMKTLRRKPEQVNLKYVEVSEKIMKNNRF